MGPSPLLSHISFDLKLLLLLLSLCNFISIGGYLGRFKNAGRSLEHTP